MKTTLQTLAILVMSAFITTASAQNIHFVSGPTITDQGNTVQLCAKLAGLGNNKLIVVSLYTTRTITTTCTNPAGHIAPGQTRTETSVVSAQYVSDNNGQVTFCVNSNTPTPGSCPNGQWTGAVTDVSFTNTWVAVNGVKVQ